MDLFQGKHPKIFAGTEVGYKMAFDVQKGASRC